MMDAPLLTMVKVSKRFGATQALRDVSLTVQPGRVLALIGENGAGKSTLMKILSGALPPDDGLMTLVGRPYSPQGPFEARRTGVAMIYQELNLAPDLSVEDNIMLGQEAARWGILRRRMQRPRVQEALAWLGHGRLNPSTPVRNLSIAQQQLVEIARALVTEARVIVFDEPTSSLTRQDTRQLFEVIRRLRDRGLGIIYISHFLEEIREVCDEFAVLRDGTSVGYGQLAGTSEAEIVALMVGRNVTELFPRIPHEVGEPIVSIDQLSGRRSPTEVSLQLHRGEIFGLAGLVGAGRTELLRCLFGLEAVRQGTIQVQHMQPRSSPRARIAAGLGMVSEDRKQEGLAQNRSIADNLTYSDLQQYSRCGWLNLGQRQLAVSQWMNALKIKARSPEQSVGELSGGNQQKVAIARVLHQGADVFLLDEPTRGIDVGTKSDIYRLMGELAAQGKTILFVSSYLTELLAVCDRIGVMSRGRLREIRPAGEWTEESIMNVAVGGD